MGTLPEIDWDHFEAVEMRVGRIIEVEDFPAFIVIDDKGNDFFKELNLG